MHKIVFTDILDYAEGYQEKDYNEMHNIVRHMILTQEGFETTFELPPNDGDYVFFIFQEYLICGGAYDFAQSEKMGNISFYPQSLLPLSEVDFTSAFDLYIKPYNYKFEETGFETMISIGDKTACYAFALFIKNKAYESSLFKNVRQVMWYLAHKLADPMIPFSTIGNLVFEFEMNNEWGLWDYNPFIYTALVKHAPPCYCCDKEMPYLDSITNAKYFHIMHIDSDYNPSADKGFDPVKKLAHHAVLCPACYYEMKFNTTDNMTKKRIGEKAIKHAIIIANKIIESMNSQKPGIHQKGISNPGNDGEIDFSKWASESVLRQNGYTVSQKEGLSDVVRQRILRNVIEMNLLSKDAICNHIESQIALRRSNIIYEVAIKKWERDLLFLRGISM